MTSAVHPVEYPVEVKGKVEVTNFPKGRYAGRTTLKTYILDPAGANPGVKNQQICGFNAARTRLVIQVIEQPVILCKETPSVSPDTSSVALIPTGRHLPVSAQEYVLYGPDEFWLNSIVGATPGRVTVTEEFL